MKLSQLYGADFLSVLHAFDTFANYDPCPELIDAILLESSVEEQFAYFVQTLFRALDHVLVDDVLTIQGSNLIGAYFYAVREI